MPILHEAGPAGTPERIPASVQRLDATCNSRIADAQTVDGLNTELHRKLAIKRWLVSVPSLHLETEARALLAALQEGR